MENPQKRVEWKKLLAELLGTFVIVFAPVGAAGAAQISGKSLTLLDSGLVSGLSVLAMIVALGHVSGAHLNPAVTIAFAATKRFEWRAVPMYVAAQALGGLAAAALAAALFVAGPGSHVPADPTNVVRNLGVEAAITFILAFTILGAATDKRIPGALPPIAIGFAVVVGTLIGGSITGGSMNPARSFGPNLLAGGAAMANYWIYVVGPIVGALVAAACHEAIRDRT